MSLCDKCKNEHNGEYGSGRFCSSKCARSFSTSKNRKEINKKVSNKLKGYRVRNGGKLKLCDYGCKQEAKYKLDNDKWCCENSYTKCYAVRRKNSKGLKKAHKEGRATGYPIDARFKGIETRRRLLQEQYAITKFEDLPIAEKRRRILFEQQFKCSICRINEWQTHSGTYVLASEVRELVKMLERLLPWRRRGEK